MPDSNFIHYTVMKNEVVDALDGINSDKIYVDCTGDGLDSNGNLYLNGGEVTVFSQAQGGDNSPLDSDGNIIINGGTIFVAGTNPMNENPTNSSTQKYITSTRRIILK